VLFIGFNPYVTNTIHFGHPFHPLAGKDKIDIMIHNYPLGFKEKIRIEKLFISLFAETGGSSVKDNIAPSLKFPFQFSKVEIYKLSKVGNRTGGFGIIFSGILILSLLVFALTILNSNYNNSRRYFYQILFLLIFSILFMSESWWARYAPQLYFIPLIILLYAEFYNQKNIKHLKNLTYLVIILNTGLLGLMTIKKNFSNTVAINGQLAKFKKQNQTLLVDYGFFRSNRIRFSENSINTMEQNLINEENTIKIHSSEAKVLNTMNLAITEDALYSEN
jgi:hypothetical protein